MKNRAVTLLALLAANDRLGQPAVLRTVLVKQAFLADTLRPLYQVWLRAFSFVRYHYGPYSDDVFESLDVLIFSGLVELTAFDRRAGKTDARYKITAAGHRVLGEINVPEVAGLAMDLVWALQCLGVEQAGTICKLVYEEAEFARIFAEHNKQGIPTDARVQLPAVTDANNATLVALATLQALRKPPSSLDRVATPVASREIVRLFLQSLAIRVPVAHKRRTAAA